MKLRVESYKLKVERRKLKVQSGKCCCGYAHKRGCIENTAVDEKTTGVARVANARVQEADGTTLTIDISKLSNGLYLYEVMNAMSEKIKSARIVISK